MLTQGDVLGLHSFGGDHEKVCVLDRVEQPEADAEEDAADKGDVERRVVARCFHVRAGDEGKDDDDNDPPYVRDDLADLWCEFLGHYEGVKERGRNCRHQDDNHGVEDLGAFEAELCDRVGWQLAQHGANARAGKEVHVEELDRLRVPERLNTIQCEGVSSQYEHFHFFAYKCESQCESLH